MEVILDTQIVSYEFKKSRILENGIKPCVSSITVSEFLLAQPKEKKKPEYYFLDPRRYQVTEDDDTGNSALYRYFKNPKVYQFNGAARTDKIIVDFNGAFPAYYEFGSNSIAIIVNTGRKRLYQACIAHLSKQKRKYLSKRLHHLIDKNYYTFALNENIIERGLNLFAEFIAQYEYKSNIRNTINDILILSTAIEYKKTLHTQDKLLSRFSANYFQAPITKNGDDLYIDFSQSNEQTMHHLCESKGYMHHGWSYVVRKRSDSKVI